MCVAAAHIPLALQARTCAQIHLRVHARTRACANRYAEHALGTRARLSARGKKRKAPGCEKEGCGAVWCLLHVRDNVLCSGGDDATIRFWDADTAGCLGTYVGHGGYGDDVGELGRPHKLSRAFAPVESLCHLGGDGARIASASYDRTICIWDVSDLEKVQMLRTWVAGDNAIVSVAAIAERRLVSCGADKEVKFWDWTSGELLAKARSRGICKCAARLSDQTVALGGGDATIRVFDWVEEKDLLGKHGFYAMEMSIYHMSRVFFEHADEADYAEPILYQTVPKSVGEAEAKEAMAVVIAMVEAAITYQPM